MITTRRLDLIPATIVKTQAALKGPVALAESLGVVVPQTWPPDYVDAAALEFVVARLQSAPSEHGWWMYFVVLRGPTPTLVGTAGYKGPPGSNGTVEIGYGIVAEHRLKGFATEAALGLVTRAFDVPKVDRVIAHTLPDLAGSIRVLEKCGFRCIGTGFEPGSIQFTLDRPPRKPSVDVKT